MALANATDIDAMRSVVEAVKSQGNQSAAARHLGIPRGRLQPRLYKARDLGLIAKDGSFIEPDPDVCAPQAEPEAPVVLGKVLAPTAIPVDASPRDGVRRFILTCAQNNTHVHGAVWENLLALSEFYGAQIMVSRFTYNKGLFARQAKPGTESVSDFDDLFYDPAIEPYIRDDEVALAPGILFCGHFNILPTATDPLSGLESYRGRQSIIVPHVKIAMTSVASGKYEATKFTYTTGTITQRNYLQKKAGQKAEFHHSYGALLVEVDDDGDWFCRQLSARDSDGTICDLDVRVERGKVTSGNRVEAITWGDTHVAQMDEDVRQAAWGQGGMLDSLVPRYQFHHDILDFYGRNHHERDNHFTMFERYATGDDVVEDEVAGVCQFLVCNSARDWCQDIIVDSNHDQALERWLKEADLRKDPPNAKFMLEALLEKYRAIAAGNANFHLVEWALRRAGCPQGVRFLREDESFVICPEAGDGIECGMHGNRGLNGARGSIRSFAKMGRKVNVGHSHTAGIYHSVYQSGTSGVLDPAYVRGPSSHSHSHIVTTAIGKRQIVTMWRGKWRAEPLKHRS